MTGFHRKSDTANPVLFYFDAADKLKEFSHFTVDETSRATPNGSHISYDVIGHYRNPDGVMRKWVVAEFPVELYAGIFRDLAAKYIS